MSAVRAEIADEETRLAQYVLCTGNRQSLACWRRAHSCVYPCCARMCELKCSIVQYLQRDAQRELDKSEENSLPCWPNLM